MNLKPLTRLFSSHKPHGQQDKRQRQAQSARLALILKSGKLRVWVYKVATNHYLCLSEDGRYEQEYNPVEFARQFHRDDYEQLRKSLFDVCEGKATSAKMLVRGSTAEGEPADRGRLYDISVSVARSNKEGKPTLILGLQHDVTEEHRRQQNVDQLLMRYHTLFNSTLVDMIFYDKDGVLSDLNEKACEDFNVTSREDVRRDKFLLKNNPLFDGISMENMQNMRSSSIVDFDRLRDDPRYQIGRFGLHGKMYYESVLNPIRDSHGQLNGVYMVGRDITEMVESYHRQQEGLQQLRTATKSIKEYVMNINYALQVSNVWLANYYPDRFMLELSTDINRAHLRLSQLRCIRLATMRFRRAVNSVLNRMEHRSPHPITQTVETEIRDKKGRQIWLIFNLVPIMSEDGRVERYFGMCRNITDNIETEQRLAVETKKAQETELLKQSFLTNMSYEIRTPLSDVLGYAELFEKEHDPKDEPFFVEQIQKSSNSLLLLINDILYLSRLDANMVEHHPVYTDFAEQFDQLCQVGWSSAKASVRTVIDNPYSHLVACVDMNLLGKVISKLCDAAAYFTQEGFIRAKYEYRGGHLAIGIEDTGMGMESDALAHFFDRFGHAEHGVTYGTGLDMPIVQLLVQLMGGTIEIQSEPGKGTTMWVTVPCAVRTMEKKMEVLS